MHLECLGAYRANHCKLPLHWAPPFPGNKQSVRGVERNRWNIWNNQSLQGQYFTTSLLTQPTLGNTNKHTTQRIHSLHFRDNTTLEEVKCKANK